MDLFSPLVSEDFTNDAVDGSARYPKDGSPGPVESGSTSITIAYDADTQTYTITNGLLGQSFAASDIDAAGSTDQFTLFTKTDGSVTDELLLSKPGDSGAFTYRYVGAGLWMRTLDGADTTDIDATAFTYGVETPDADLPRTGTATFVIDLLGYLAYDDIATTLVGSGGMNVSFLTGDLEFRGLADQFDAIDATYYATLPFSGTGALSSSANTFSGDINVGYFVGTHQGRFYGPNAEEVGLAWNAQIVLPGVTYAGLGTITGRQGQPAGLPDTLLTRPALYSDPANVGEIIEIKNDAVITDGTPGFVASVREFEIEAGEFNFRILGDSTNREVSFGFEDFVYLNNYFVYFRKTVGDETHTVALNNTGNPNAEVPLTYASFGYWFTDIPGAADGETVTAKRYFTFGEYTSADNVPTTGSASFAGKLYGSGTGTFTSGQANREYTLVGDIALTFDFGANSIDGTMSPIFVDVATRQGYNFGPINMRANNIGTPWSGRLQGDFRGDFWGSFFGPNAEEIAAVFEGSGTNPTDPNEFIDFQGAFIGNRD